MGIFYAGLEDAIIHVTKILELKQKLTQEEFKEQLYNQR